ncbi:methyltransferase domain-containing protein [Kribbella catacumbae]|uniref:methyltransferase domain-containing protein n=1 Tax=Kribbella catacumbae TaxID=460086 RepID=UPI0003721956|nr:methyltransferase domain-containing protein [Kribbella catacumbae]
MTLDNDSRFVRHLDALVDELVDSGLLRSPRWRAAFAATPRHIFLPRFFHPDPTTGDVRQTTSQDPDWLEIAYTDQPLATQFNGEPGDTSGIPTSSSTAPSLMVTMLELLDLHPRHTVLEIGTGTGYNAALLSTYLGDCNVTTVDVDGALTGPARDRLAVLDLHPTVATADGAAGYPDRAPYDRIIATCAVRRIPMAWLEQTKPGGKILVTLETSLHGYGLALLTIDQEQQVDGCILPDAASFMPMRSQADPLFVELRAAAAPRQNQLLTTTIRAEDLESNDARFAVGLQLPDVAAFGIESRDGQSLYLAHHTDGSWAELHPDQTVTAGGPTDLWRPLEATYLGWVGAGRPGPHQVAVSFKTFKDRLVPTVRQTT